MLQLIALCLLVWFAIHTTGAFWREQAVFSRLGQTTAVRWLVWLYPLPFVLPLLHRPLIWLLFFPIPLAALFFAPAIVTAAQNRKCFDKSGDDKVRPATAAVDNVITVGIMGILGTFALTAWLWLRKH